MPITDRSVLPFGRDIAEMERNLARLKDGGGDGTSGGVSDDWKASVDRQLDELHGDIRKLLTGVIAGFLFVIAGGAAFYASLAGQIADTRKDIAAIQVEQAKTNGKLDLLLERTAPKDK